MDAIRSSEELLSATLEGNEEKVALMIEQVHQENISILKYNHEHTLACVISLAYYSEKRIIPFIANLQAVRDMMIWYLCHGARLINRQS